jgi:hypothetical protein
VVAGWGLIAASSAQASVVTIGSPLTATFSGTFGCSCTFAQTALPGATIASPIDGTVVRWRVKAATGPGGFKLRVLRPAGFGADLGAGTSTTGTPVSTGTQVFTTSLPIQAGDLIGLDPISSEAVGAASTSASTVALWQPPLADGATIGPNGTGSTTELAYNADVQPLPGVSSLSPSSGPVTGGTPVTITGHDFTGTTAVNFGSAPAASFSVDSDSQITAVSPAAPAGGVDVSVQNPGLSPAVGTDRFNYQQPCVVPKLKGKKLKAAKKALIRASCLLGKVRPKGQTSGTVEKQKPAAGTVLPAGSKVNVRLTSA